MAGADPFDYLLEKTAAISAEELETMAKIAAKRYLEEHAALNETIRKFASERDLNAHQIERVCEMANLATHRALWPSARQKEKIAFELADAKRVKAQSEPASGAKADDYAAPPSRIPASGPSLARLLGVSSERGHEGLAGSSKKQALQRTIEKKAAERQRMQDQLLCAGMEAETAEKQAFEAIKQERIGGVSLHRIFRAAAAVGLDKVARDLLPGFERRLSSDVGSGRGALEKTAIARAPEDLISADLGATTIVNGAHPVLVSLDTVDKKNGVVKNLLHNLLRIDDELRVYRQELKELG